MHTIKNRGEIDKQDTIMMNSTTFFINFSFCFSQKKKLIFPYHGDGSHLPSSSSSCKYLLNAV